MNTRVSSCLGQSLLFDGKSEGKITAIYFAVETGKMSGVATAGGGFYAADGIFFSEDEVSLRRNEKSAPVGKNWIGLRVVSADREREFGHVEDIEFSANLMVITKIVARNKLLGVPVSQRIFPFERIVDVRDEMVIVDDDASDNEEGELIPAI